MDDAGALVLADLVPRDDAMLVARLPVGVRSLLERCRHGIQLVIWAAIPPADQLGAALLFDDLEVAAQGGLERSTTEPEEVLSLADLHVAELGADGRGHVGGQRPRRGRPDEERLTGSIDERKTDGQPRILSVGVALVHLHLAHAGA